MKPIVEFKILFELSRLAIDDVERGSEDSDWGPLQEFAQKIAYAEDRAVFDGYAAAAIEGMREVSSHKAFQLPANIKKYPEVLAKAVSALRLAGVNGSYALILGNDAYAKATGGSDEGFPLLSHIEHLIDSKIIWVPAIEGGAVVSLRGGDFQFNLGQDISIGYDSHTTVMVTLYFIESFNFRLWTPKVIVSLSPVKKYAYKSWLMLSGLESLVKIRSLR